MGIFSIIWACPFRVGLRLQVLAMLWAFHLRPHAFSFFSIIYQYGFQPQKNSQKGSQIGLRSVQQGYSKQPSAALAFTSLFSPFCLLSFFSFFLLGLCVCGGWGRVGVLVLCFIFFCFRHGWLCCFFFLFPCCCFAAAGCCCFVRFLRFSFRCSARARLGWGARFASCFPFGFLRLRWWSVCPRSFLLSFRCGLFRFCFRWWSFGLRSSLCGARSVCGCFPSPSVGFFPCSPLSCGARSFRFPLSLLCGFRFGFVGFRCPCCGVGCSCALVAACWGRSSCCVGLCFVGWWFLSPPVVCNP